MDGLSVLFWFFNFVLFILIMASSNIKIHIIIIRWRKHLQVLQSLIIKLIITLLKPINDFRLLFILRELILIHHDHRWLYQVGIIKDILFFIVLLALSVLFAQFAHFGLAHHYFLGFVHLVGLVFDVVLLVLDQVFVLLLETIAVELVVCLFYYLLYFLILSNPLNRISNINLALHEDILLLLRIHIHILHLLIHRSQLQRIILLLLLRLIIILLRW